MQYLILHKLDVVSGRLKRYVTEHITYCFLIEYMFLLYNYNIYGFVYVR